MIARLAAQALLLATAFAAPGAVADLDLTLTPAPARREDPAKTAELVARLGSSDPAARKAAFRSIATEYSARTFPPGVLGPLAAGLSDHDGGIRRDAAFSLAGLASKVYISSRSRDGSAFGRDVAVDFSQEPGVRSALIAGLASADPEVRRYSPLALGMAFGAEPEIESALLSRWKVKKEKPARRNIVVALGKGGYRSEGTVALLKEAVDDPDRVVRIRARRALKRLGAAAPAKKP